VTSVIETKGNPKSLDNWGAMVAVRAESKLPSVLLAGSGPKKKLRHAFLSEELSFFLVCIVQVCQAI
jgi:hypothetical protein